MRMGSAVVLLAASSLVSAQQTTVRVSMSDERATQCKQVLDRVTAELANKGVGARVSSADQVAAEVCEQATLVATAQKIADSPEKTRGMKPERLQTVQDNGNRLMRQFNEKGSDAILNGFDLQSLADFVLVSAAVECLAANQEGQRKAAIKPDLLAAGIPAAERVLAAFNEDGSRANFGPTDRWSVKQLYGALQAAAQKKH